MALGRAIALVIAPTRDLRQFGAGAVYSAYSGLAEHTLAAWPPFGRHRANYAIGKRFDTLMNMKRMRGRNNNHRSGGGGGNQGGGGPVRSHGGNMPLNRNHVFDSNGPDLRVRGTAQQLFEKYLQLGRDAASSGDRVMAEGYLQHAEHYFRILNAMNQAAQQNQGHGTPYPRQPNQQDSDGDSEEQPDINAPQPVITEQRHESREIPIAAVPAEG